MADRRSRTRLRLGAVAVVFSLFFYFNAYVCDDAFLTFRTVDNLVRGHGMRWNVEERVQAFTSPLHTLLLAGLYWFSHDASDAPNPDRIYCTAIFLSYALSLATILWLAFSWLRSALLWPAFLLLTSSQAFVTFTSSGLETPLLYLFTALFHVRFLATEPRTRSDLLQLLLWPALGVLTRMDAVLLFLPGVAWVLLRGLRVHGRAITGPLLLASLPVLLWFGFALVYYGSLLPITYYAKIGMDVDRSILHEMGWAYLRLNFIQDPITLVAIAAGILLSLLEARAFLSGLSSLLYVAYIHHIGGDFLGFRFLAPSFLLSAILIHRFFHRRWPRLHPAWAAASAAALLAYGLATPSSPLRIVRDGPAADDVRFYFDASSLARWRPGMRFPFAQFHSVEDPEACRTMRTSEFQVTVGGGGLQAFCAGPRHHFVIPMGITDPLLARLPLAIDRDFLPGHVPWPLPAGYVASLRRRENLVEDPDLAAYYDKIRSLARDPLFALERWRHILDLNFTSARRYRAAYLQADPPYPSFLSQHRPSLVDRVRRIERLRGR